MYSQEASQRRFVSLLRTVFTCFLCSGVDEVCPRTPREKCSPTLPFKGAISGVKIPGKKKKRKTGSRKVHSRDAS